MPLLRQTVCPRRRAPRRAAWLALAGALLAAGAACNVSTKPSSFATVQLALSQDQPPVPPPGSTPEVTATVDRQFITVNGIFVSQCIGELRPDISLDRRALKLRVVNGYQGSCLPEISAHKYEALISLLPGTYDLTVLHQGDRDAGTGPVLTKTLTTTQ